MSTRRPEIIARGPERIPQDPDSWQYRAYLQGKRFYEPVQPGQRFPEGAGQKELDEIAGKLPGTVGKLPAYTTAAVAKLELAAEPEQEPEVLAQPEAAAA